MTLISIVCLIPFGLIGAVNPIITLSAYAVLGGMYLFVVPLFLFYWMNNRWNVMGKLERLFICLLYTSPSPRDRTRSRMPSSA